MFVNSFYSVLIMVFVRGADCYLHNFVGQLPVVLLREQIFNLFTKKLYTKRLLNLMCFIQ